MKEALIWICILSGPVLAFIGMRRHRVSWNTTSGVVALVAAAVTVAAGVLLLKMY